MTAAEGGSTGPRADAAVPHREVGMVWAQSADGVIGVAGALPWHLPEDLAHFRAVTAGRTVVMGRTTWLSLPPRFRPLPGRRNLVLSREAGLALEGAEVLPSVDAALDAAGEDRLWVVGGGQVYAAFEPFATVLEVTHVDVVVGPGTPAPAVGPGWRVVARDPAEGWLVARSGLRYRFTTARREPTSAPRDAPGPQPPAR